MGERSLRTEPYLGDQPITCQRCTLTLLATHDEHVTVDSKPLQLCSCAGGVVASIKMMADEIPSAQ